MLLLCSVFFSDLEGQAVQSFGAGALKTVVAEIFSDDNGVQAVVAESVVQADCAFVAGDGFDVKEVRIGLDDFLGKMYRRAANAAVLPGGQDKQSLQPVGRAAPAAQVQETNTLLVMKDKKERVLSCGPCLQVLQGFLSGLVCKAMTAPEILDQGNSGFLLAAVELQMDHGKPPLVR